MQFAPLYKFEKVRSKLSIDSDMAKSNKCPTGHEEATID